MSDTPETLDELVDMLNRMNCGWKNRAEELTYFAEKLENKINRLQAQMLKMRCCDNCRYFAPVLHNVAPCNQCPNHEKWEPIP